MAKNIILVFFSLTEAIDRRNDNSLGSPLRWESKDPEKTIAGLFVSQEQNELSENRKTHTCGLGMDVNKHDCEHYLPLLFMSAERNGAVFREEGFVSSIYDMTTKSCTVVTKTASGHTMTRKICLAQPDAKYQRSSRPCPDKNRMGPDLCSAVALSAIQEVDKLKSARLSFNEVTKQCEAFVNDEKVTEYLCVPIETRSQYALRMRNHLPTTMRPHDQGRTDNCWAHALVHCIESVFMRSSLARASRLIEEKKIDHDNMVKAFTTERSWIFGSNHGKNNFDQMFSWQCAEYEVQCKYIWTTSFFRVHDREKTQNKDRDLGNLKKMLQVRPLYVACEILESFSDELKKLYKRSSERNRSDIILEVGKLPLYQSKGFFSQREKSYGHAIQFVEVGNFRGTDYVTVKDSYGSFWDPNGFFRVALSDVLDNMSCMFYDITYPNYKLHPHTSRHKPPCSTLQRVPTSRDCQLAAVLLKLGPLPRLVEERDIRKPHYSQHIPKGCFWDAESQVIYFQENYHLASNKKYDSAIVPICQRKVKNTATGNLEIEWVVAASGQICSTKEALLVDNKAKCLEAARSLHLKVALLNNRDKTKRDFEVGGVLADGCYWNNAEQKLYFGIKVEESKADFIEHICMHGEIPFRKLKIKEMLGDDVFEHVLPEETEEEKNKFSKLLEEDKKNFQHEYSQPGKL